MIPAVAGVLGGVDGVGAEGQGTAIARSDGWWWCRWPRALAVARDQVEHRVGEGQRSGVAVDIVTRLQRAEILAGQGVDIARDFDVVDLVADVVRSLSRKLLEPGAAGWLPNEW